MANPCIVIFKGTEYSHDEFMGMLHDGLLDNLVEAKIIEMPVTASERAKAAKVGKGPSKMATKLLTHLGIEPTGPEKEGAKSSFRMENKNDVTVVQKLKDWVDEVKNNVKNLTNIPIVKITEKLNKDSVPMKIVTEENFGKTPQNKDANLRVEKPELIDSSELNGKEYALNPSDHLTVGVDPKTGVFMMGGVEFPLIKANIDNGIGWAVDAPGVVTKMVNAARQTGGRVATYIMGEGSNHSNDVIYKRWLNDVEEKLSKNDKKVFISYAKKAIDGIIKTKENNEYKYNVESISLKLKNIKTVEDLTAFIDDPKISRELKAKIVDALTITKDIKPTSEIGVMQKNNGIITMDEILDDISADPVKGSAVGDIALVFDIDIERHDRERAENEGKPKSYAQAGLGDIAHSNYEFPIYIKDGSLKYLKQQPNIVSISPEMSAEVLGTAEIGGLSEGRQTKTGKSFSADSATSNTIRTAGLKGFARDFVSGKPAKFGPAKESPLKTFTKLLNRSFPNIEIKDNVSDFNAALKDLNAKKLITLSDKVYGVVLDGVVYLNPKFMSLNTQLHEIGHVWLDVAKSERPEIYKKGLDLIENDKVGDVYVENVLKSKEYKRIIDKMRKDGASEAEINEYVKNEALASLVGDKGELFFKEIKGKEKLSPSDISLIEKVKAYIDQFYTVIKDLSGIKNFKGDIKDMTLSDYVDAVLGEIAGGEKISDITSKNLKKISSETQGRLRVEGSAEQPIESKIKDFIEQERAAGETDASIRKGIEEIADQIGIDKTKIDELFQKEVKPKEGAAEKEVIGITKAAMKQERVEANLTDADKQYITKDRKSQWSEVINETAKNPNLPKEKIAAIIAGEKYDSKDILFILHEKATLKTEMNENAAEIRKASKENKGTVPADLLLQRERLEGQKADILNALDFAGSKAGDVLQVFQSVTTEDLDFATMKKDIESEQGRPLTDEQEDMLRDVSNRNEELQAELSDLKERSKVIEAETRAKAEAELIEKYKQKPAEKPAKKESTFKLSEKEVKRKTELRKEFSGMFNDITNIPALLLNKKFLEYGKLIAKETAFDFAEFSKKAIGDLGEKVKPILKEWFDKSSAEAPKGKKTKEGNIDEQFNSLAEEVAAKYSEVVEEMGDDFDGKLPKEIKDGLLKMIENRVKKDIKTDINRVTDDIFNAVEPLIPGVDKTELRDLMTGYGDYKEPKPNKIKEAVAEIKLQGRLDAKYEATERGELPLRNGFKRAEQSQLAREKNAKIANNIRDKNLTPPLTQQEISARYKTKEDALEKSLTNAIEDLNKEIETGIKKEKKRSGKITNQRIEDLQKDKERLIKIRNEKFKEPAKTELQKLVDKATALTKKIGEAKKEGDKKTEEQLKQEKELTKGAISNLKKSLEVAKTEGEKKIASLQNQIDDIRFGKEKKEKGEPVYTPEEQKKIDALNAELDRVKEESGMVAGKAMPGQATQNALLNAIANIRDEILNIKSGKTPKGKDIAVTTKEGKKVFKLKQNKAPKVDTQRIRELQDLKDGLLAEYQNLLPENVKNEALIEKNKAQSKKTLKDLQDLLKKGETDKSVFETKTKEEKVVDEETKKILIEIEKLKGKVLAEKNKLKETKKGKFQKAIEFASKVKRFDIFANPFGMLRLVYAAMYRPIMKPGVEIARYVLSNLPVTKEVLKKSPATYRPTLGSVGRNLKNYYTDLVAKQTGLDAVSEFNKRSNFSLLHEKREVDRFTNKTEQFLAAPEQFHGFLKTFPKTAEYKSSYKSALENLSNTIDPETGKLYDITSEKVQQVADADALRNGLADVFMNDSEGGRILSAQIGSLLESENIGLQTVGAVMKQLEPVIKVPQNFYHELLQEIPIVGLLDAAQIIYRSGEKNGPQRGIKNLTSEQANRASRALVNQAIGYAIVGTGVALVAAGYGEEVKKKLKEYEYWLHNSGVLLLLLGLDIGESMKGEKEKEGKGVAAATAEESLKLITEKTKELPQVRFAKDLTYKTAELSRAIERSDYDDLSKKSKEAVVDIFIPSGVSKIAEKMDVNEKMDELQERDPETWLEIIEAKIPGLREYTPKKASPHIPKNKAIKSLMEKKEYQFKGPVESFDVKSKFGGTVEIPKDILFKITEARNKSIEKMNISDYKGLDNEAFANKVDAIYRQAKRVAISSFLDRKYGSGNWTVVKKKK